MGLKEQPIAVAAVAEQLVAAPVQVALHLDLQAPIWQEVMARAVQVAMDRRVVPTMALAAPRAAMDRSRQVRQHRVSVGAAAVMAAAAAPRMVMRQ